VHGIADISHADQFLWALEHEMKKVKINEAEKAIEEVLAKGYALLKAIFLGEVQ
jgi:hypothetical protein